MSLRVAPRTGIAAGIGIVTTGGMDTVAALLMALGLSSILDSILGGGHTVTPTITTTRTIIIRTIILRTGMTRAFTTRTMPNTTVAAPNTTVAALMIRQINTRTRLLPPSRSDWQEMVITVERSTAFS